MDTTVSTDASAEVDVDALRSALSATRDLLAQAERERDALADWKHRAVQDMGILSSALMREANNRGWCSEYDDVVDYVNSDMNVLQLTRRLRTFSRQVTVDMTFRVTREIEIEAYSEEEADDIIKDDLYGYLGGAQVEPYEIADTIDLVDIRSC
jgi:predicted transcriptional regulator